MTNVCPQCKFPLPREGSRYCNQCGADLRGISTSRPISVIGSGGAPGSKSEDAPNSGAAVADDVPVRLNSAPNNHQNISENNMVASQNDAKPQRPEATLHILLRDGSVIERDLVNDETKIGKGPNNDLILADASVSGTHAMISFADGAFVLSDLGSRNGTLLNDVKITEPRPIQHGDLIKMGHCTLTFRLKEAGDTLSMTRTQMLDPSQPPPPPAPPPGPKPAAMTEETLASALISSGLVAQAEVERLQGPDARGRRLCRALLEENLITEIGLRDLMSRTFNIAPVELKTMEIDAAAASKLRPQFLRERLVCPIVGPGADRLLIAVADPTDKATIEEIQKITHKQTSLRLAMPSEIVAHLNAHFTPRLVGVLPTGEKIEALLNEPETEIGKATHNRLVISHPTVSSTHAILLARDGGYSVVDLGSSNGTFVNDSRLGNDAHTLQHGDKIQLGQVLLTFRNPAETTENKTARLSLEALEEVRRRANVRLSPTGSRTDPTAGPSTLGGLQPLPAGALVPIPGAAAAEDDTDKKDKEKKKKKKEDDRLKAAWVGGISRIIAQVMGVLLTVGLTVYLLNRTPGGGHSGSSPSSNASNSDSGSTLIKNRLAPAGAWKGFSTGLFGGAVEASGVAYSPGANGVLFVSDSSESDVLWMQLDEEGKQVGSIKSVPLGVKFKDPEAITHGNSYFYLATSQAEPKDGALNSIVRFDFNPETQTLRGPAEIITDFRSFLLSHVTELASLGAPPGMQGGLNIEGIAWDPNNERLLVGLRSPLIGNQAVLAPLKLRDPRGQFKVENLKIDEPRVIVLSLEGHGVRDIAYDPRLKNFLIISGAPETSPKTDFILWEWNGQPDSKPVKLMTLDDKMKPEGLTSATINGRNFVFLVGDAGSYLKLNYVDAK